MKERKERAQFISISCLTLPMHLSISNFVAYLARKRCEKRNEREERRKWEERKNK